MITIGSPSVNIQQLAVESEQASLGKLDYSEAVLLITYIKAENLKNTEYIGKADPIIYLSLGGWSAETEPKENAGGSVIWVSYVIALEYLVI